ncbi:MULTISPECIES: hypothetical protein [unclassified Streptomyces]|uniref:hypothetical protein n=1 Tax=unclassified Streptomyces TaxID=2593676 RepID=UPI002DD9032F|nr:hypothetical protein [Streptomyces sp. NBC_01768]WSC32364.1 hypothetical protein OG902_39905 [Streptomyces sp. NBC_01768]WSX06415.1 hypothetical protein OG355_41575 [Streptomyces sp. NBC_00987]
MALLKGKGMMTGVNLIAKVYKTGITKDGKSQYIDVQVDARDPRGPEQTNLHLRSERVTGDDGKTRFNNGAPYSVGQMAEIAKAAGPNTEPILDKGGKEVGTLYGFKGNVMPASRGTGLVVNTKAVEPSDFKVDDKTLDNQFASMRSAHKAHTAAQEAQRQAPEAVQAAEAEEPSVG